MSDKDDEKKEKQKKEDRAKFKQETLEAYELAKNDPDLLAAARKFDRKVKKGDFDTPKDAEDYWQNILNESKWVQNLSNASFGSYVQEADPTMAGEVTAQRSSVELDVANAARQLGLELDPARLAELTEMAWREEYDSGEIRNLLRDDLTGALAASEDNLGFSGNLGDAAADLSAWSSRNGFTISQNDADAMLASVAFGDKSLDQIKSELRTTYMTGAYPAWAEMINAGIDIYELAGPYRSVAQRMLGRGNIDMNDPIMKEMMQVQNADGSFSQRALWEAERYIRNTDEWQGTDDAAATYAKGMNAVSAMFGFG